jgi:biopolymer transport protein ExbB/TolQ
MKLLSYFAVFFCTVMTAARLMNSPDYFFVTMFNPRFGENYISIYPLIAFAVWPLLKKSMANAEAAKRRAEYERQQIISRSEAQQAAIQQEQRRLAEEERQRRARIEEEIELYYRKRQIDIGHAQALTELQGALLQKQAEIQRTEGDRQRQDLEYQAEFLRRQISAFSKMS